VAQDSTKLYAGVGLGLTEFKSDHAGIAYRDTPIGWQVYSGLQAREGMAVELAVERLANISSKDLLGSGVQRLRISADHAAVTVRGAFSLPLEEILQRRPKITVFGTVGVARLFEKRDVLELTTSLASSTSEHDTVLTLGAGVTFEIARVRLRNYVQWADRRAGGLDTVGVAAEFRF
jgi:opacity protein-like surface antigen